MREWTWEIEILRLGLRGKPTLPGQTCHGHRHPEGYLTDHRQSRVAHALRGRFLRDLDRTLPTGPRDIELKRRSLQPRTYPAIGDNEDTAPGIRGTQAPHRNVGDGMPAADPRRPTSNGQHRVRSHPATVQ